MSTDYNYDEQVAGPVLQPNRITDSIAGPIFPLLHHNHLRPRHSSPILYPPQTEQRLDNVANPDIDAHGSLTAAQT